VGFRGGKGAVSRGYYRGSTPPGQTNTTDAALYWYTVRTIQHEFSHNYGAPHCEEWECVMGPNGLWDVRTSRSHIWCSPCSSAISRNADSYGG
jgi:predicted Zn-dependent protease